MNTSKIGTTIAGLLAAVVLLIVVIVVPATTDDECPQQGTTMGQGVTGDTGVTLAGLGEGQLQLARNGVAIGTQRGLPESVILSESMAAATESTYRNLANTTVPESLAFPHDGEGSDHDSVGPHQMRVSVFGAAGMAALMDPIYQINWFYDTAVAQPGYESMDPGALAQAVERSSPNAYNAQKALAQQVVETFRGVGTSAGGTSSLPADLATPLGGADCAPGVNGAVPSFAPGTGFGQKVVQAALAFLGTTYSWGGGDENGPTLGLHDGGVADSYGDYAKTGFDCSGLTKYAVAQASGKSIILPHNDQAQMADPHGTPITDPAALLPGDIVVPHNGHVFIWMGGGQVVEAPQSGDVVKISPYTPSGDWQARRFG